MPETAVHKDNDSVAPHHNVCAIAKVIFDALVDAKTNSDTMECGPQAALAACVTSPYPLHSP